METAQLSSASFWHDDEALALVLSNPLQPADAERVQNAVRGYPALHGHFVLATSGSSGSGAKWVALSRRAMRVSAEAVNIHLQVTSDDRWLCALPLFHVGGLGIYARAAVAGCEVVKHSGDWHAAEFAEQIAIHRITLTSLVPTQVFDLVDSHLQAPECLRAVVVGGGRLDPQLYRSARLLGWPVLTSYGMTETASQIATQSIAGSGSRIEESDAPRLELKVLPHFELRVSDDGELAVRSDCLFSGYVELSPDDQVSIRSELDGDGWFSTHDLGSIDGGVLQVEGRVDRSVKILGELVSIDRVESRLQQLLPSGKARQVVVLEVRDLRRGFRLVPIFEAAATHAEVKQAWQSYHRSAAPLERLEEAVFVDAIPRSPLGKVRRASLRDITRLR